MRQKYIAERLYSDEMQKQCRNMEAGSLISATCRVVLHTYIHTHIYIFKCQDIKSDLSETFSYEKVANRLITQCEDLKPLLC